MREFLYNQILQYSTNRINEFQKALVGPRPFYNTPGVNDENTFVWGSNDRGWWTVNLYEGRFFEHNGTIHIVGWLRDFDYFSMYKLFYDNLKDNSFIRLSEPISIEEGKLRIDGHPNGKSADDKTYYIKLKTPTGNYGKTFLLNRTLVINYDREINNYTHEYINDLTWFFESAKNSNTNGPELIKNNIRLTDSTGVFYTVLPRFVVPLTTSIQQHFDYIEKTFIPLLNEIDAPTALQYARDKWIPLMR